MPNPKNVEFLGFIVGHEGLKLDPSKVRAIRERPNLASKVVEVHQFVGFVQYARKFINHFSAIAAPLTNICKAKTTFKWTELE